MTFYIQSERIIIMKLEEELNTIIESEKIRPTFSHHHINSYLTNQPINPNNFELLNIAHYFQSEENYLALHQETEFKNNLKIEVKCEMIDNYDLKHNINYRESIYHNHDFFEIIYVYKGLCQTIINDNKLTINSSQVCLFNLQAIHKLIIPNPETVVFNILIGKELFNDTFLNLFYDTNFVSSFYINSIYNIANPQKYLLISLADDGLFYIHHLILEFIKKNNYYSKIMQADLTSLLLCITRYIENNISNITQLENEANINKVLSYIYKNYNSITLNDLSNHFGYSTRTMNRYLKKYMNTTFKSIIKNCKLNNAKEYLLQTDYSIEHIAEITGFSDRSHFDHFFKNVYHITPTNFRNKFKQKNV